MRVLDLGFPVIQLRSMPIIQGAVTQPYSKAVFDQESRQQAAYSK
ncbi:hypothetical protein OROHE_017135 [Orobanche hederae]